MSIEKLMNNKLTKVTIDSFALWFSYETLVAIETDSARYVQTNVWGNTTGRHLNYIDNGDKESRLDSAAFSEVVDSLNISIG